MSSYSFHKLLEVHQQLLHMLALAQASLAAAKQEAYGQQNDEADQQHHQKEPEHSTSSWEVGCALPDTPIQLFLVAHQQLHDMLDMAAERCDAARKEFHTRRRQIDELNEKQQRCFFLDVGGQSFHVSSHCLLSGRSKFLAILVSGDFASEITDDGYAFIDRDPHWFPLVLAYVRAVATLLPHDDTQKKALHREAVYYQLEVLQRTIFLEPCIILVNQPSWPKAPAIKVYNIWKKTWNTLPSSCLVDYRILGCCVVEGDLYLAANYLSDDSMVLIQYDPRSGEHKLSTQLPIAVRDCQLEYVKPMIVVAGQRKGMLYTFIQQYYIDANNWGCATELQNMNCVTTSCVINSQLILANPSGDVVVCSYDANGKQWRLLHKYWSGLELCAVTVFSGLLMVIGSKDLSYRVYCPIDCAILLDVETGNLVGELPRLVSRRTWPKALSIDNKVFLMGGRRKDGSQNLAMEMLEESSKVGRWAPVTNVPKAHFPFYAAALWL